jgi:hypothetical protein
MSRRWQTKPVPSVWSEKRPQGTLFRARALARAIHGLWGHMRCGLTDALQSPAPSADRAVNALYIATDIPRHDAPFGRPISDKNAQAHGLHEPLFRIAGRLPFLSRPKKGVATLCRR